jgi:hypothetical protein
MSCLSKDKDDNSCIHGAIGDTKFCKFHQYMKDYTDDMLTKLTKCSGCRKLYYLDGDTKSCDKCKARSINKNTSVKQNAVLCSKEGCKNKRSVENIYCNSHQLQLFIDETKLAGKKLCYNHKRGCRTQLDESYTKSRCEPCLVVDREKDKMRRCGNCTPTNTVVTEKVEDTKIENKKESIENIENKERPIEDTKIEDVKEPIEDVKTAVVIQKPKFQKKTPEQLKEDRRIRKQKQRETLKAKLGVEEYNKLRAKEIATNRDTKKK